MPWTESLPQHTLSCCNNGGKAGLLSVRSAYLLAPLLFLPCICYFKRVHNAPIFRLFRDAPEPRAQYSRQAAQNDIPTDETCHAASFPFSWHGASISGPIMREEPVAVVQSCLLRNPTPQKPLPMLLLLLDTSEAPWGSSP